MKDALLEIAELVKSGEVPSQKQVDLILREHSKSSAHPAQRLSKRALSAYFIDAKTNKTALWEELALTETQANELVRLLRAKPRRTASGVATVTVLTKPWPCSNDCVYCPNDVRMPKSYLSNEPACQRAERCFFDPYLQMARRLEVLQNMGHNTDKIEVIILGGTWLDYQEEYRLWFMCQLFRALNEFGSSVQHDEIRARTNAYECARDVQPSEKDNNIAAWQVQINAGKATYADAFVGLRSQRAHQTPHFDDDLKSREELFALHACNEAAYARCVGLVVETRPETVSAESLTELRKLGVTKVQIGIQTLDDEILALNNRYARVEDTKHALALLRLFGFKSHVHMMANLLGATREGDLQHYRELVSDPCFLPDEIKLYPCALVDSARLKDYYQKGTWTPYEEENLIELLAQCVRLTPPFTRISRMIRDIPSDEILCGSKKTNLRQLVENHVGEEGGIETVGEMRLREIATDVVDADDLDLQEIRYSTSNTVEYFLQWVNSNAKLAGFLRLSLPNPSSLRELNTVSMYKFQENEAMIREVHVYGRTSRIHENEEGNQHVGLGRALVERACEIAREEGYTAINVISAVGTRAYYRKLNFEDGKLYQKRKL